MRNIKSKHRRRLKNREEGRGNQIRKGKDKFRGRGKVKTGDKDRAINKDRSKVRDKVRDKGKARNRDKDKDKDKARDNPPPNNTKDTNLALTLTTTHKTVFNKTKKATTTHPDSAKEEHSDKDHPATLNSQATVHLLHQ